MRRESSAKNEMPKSRKGKRHCPYCRFVEGLHCDKPDAHVCLHRAN